MSEQPALLQLINMARPNALVGDPKLSGKLAALVNVGLLPGPRYYQPPIRCAKCRGRSAGRRTLAALHVAPRPNQQIQPLLGMQTGEIQNKRTPLQASGRSEIGDRTTEDRKSTRLN